MRCWGLLLRTLKAEKKFYFIKADWQLNHAENFVNFTKQGFAIKMILDRKNFHNQNDIPDKENTLANCFCPIPNNDNSKWQGKWERAKNVLIKIFLFFIQHSIMASSKSLLYSFIKLCAQFKLFLSFSLYNILMLICNLFYITVDAILKQAIPLVSHS